MAFKKGHKRVGGMQKGQKSEKVQAWESLRDKLLNGLTEKAIEELSKLQGEKFLIQYANLLEYFQPKLSRTENKNENFNRVILVTDNEFKQQLNDILE